MWRGIAKRSVPILALFVAGLVVVAVAGGTTAGYAVGYALLGLAGILLVGLVFYEVGLSEDRDRARRG